MTSFLQSQPAPGYKPHHLKAIQARQNLAVPTAQKRLKELLSEHFAADFAQQNIVFLESHAWEFGLTVGLIPSASLHLLTKLRDLPQFSFNMLVDLTAVDWLDSRPERFQVVYHLLSLTYLHRLCVKVSLAEAKAEIDSVRALWSVANFFEREVWDMFGIRFAGHGDLRRILMYDEFVGHPLRKDYPLRAKQARIELRAPELRNTADDLQREVLVKMPSRRLAS